MRSPNPPESGTAYMYVTRSRINLVIVKLTKNYCSVWVFLDLRGTVKPSRLLRVRREVNTSFYISRCYSTIVVNSTRTFQLSWFIVVICFVTRVPPPNIQYDSREQQVNTSLQSILWKSFRFAVYKLMLNSRININEYIYI